MVMRFKNIPVQILFTSLAFVCTISLRDTRRSVRDLFLVTTTITGIGPELICSRIPGLSPQQITICHKNPSIFTAIQEGYELGSEECENQFKFHRWNCSNFGLKSIFGERAIPGTREAAFTHAIMSAGVTHRITHACTLGNMSECNCDDRRKGQKSPKGWTWGGCSADVGFGELFAQKFMTQSGGHDRVVGLINAHNSQTGREALKESLRTQCRCHGPSGSCTTKTCWQELPDFKAVGENLKALHNSVVLVESVKRNTRHGKRDAYLVVKSAAGARRPDTKELVFTRTSDPNYCDFNAENRIPGTQGRLCNMTSTGVDGCELLCCGRGYDTHLIQERYRCHCKFHWCCNVVCKKCKRRTVHYRCK